MAGMVVDSVKFIGATVFFTRSLVKALVEYARENKAPLKDGPKGINMDKKGLPKQLPSHVDIKKALPKHCFQPTVATSMYYAIKDFVLIAITYFVIQYLHQFENPFIWYPSLIMYWAFQGTLFTAVFVIGHDCGHDSFSMYPVLNDIVGTIFHGFLFVPFYMWKLSHRHHHKNNNNFDKDEVFYPVKKSDPCSKNAVLPGFGFGVGWFGYLMKGYSPRNVPHFNPFDRFYAGHVFGCSMSILTLTIWGSCLYKYATIYGFMALFNYWFVPTFIFASYCVIITFLHHSEMNIPWYADNEWDFVRGQLSTIDRDYGIVHYLIHSIGTHQMHHMFTKIPHYHLEEATQHFRKAFPDLVRVCDEPIMASFMRMFKKYSEQSAMDDDTAIHYYK